MSEHTAAPTPRPVGAAAPWPRGLYMLLITATSIIVIAGMKAFASSLSTIFLALILVVLARPVQELLARRGLPAWACLGGLLLTSYGILAVIAGSLAWSIAELVNHLAGDTYDEQIAGYEADIEDLLARFGYDTENLQPLIDQVDLGAVAGQAVSALSGVLGFLSLFSLLVISMLFMAVDSGRFTQLLDDAVAEQRPGVVEALHSFARDTRSYFIVTTVFGLIVAVLDVVALMILGVPLALVWGVLSLITNYIPNIGFVLGLIPPALLALLTGGWQLALAVVIVYSLINVIIQSVLQPRFVGNAVGLSTTLTFLSLIFWGWVFGALGALLAVPMTLLAKAILIDVDPDARWVSPLVSLNAPEVPDPEPGR